MWRARATDDCRAFAGHGTPLGLSILGAIRPAGGDGRAEMGPLYMYSRVTIVTREFKIESRNISPHAAHTRGRTVVV